MRRRRFSEEQIRRARSVCVLEWVRKTEPELLKKTSANEYLLLPHSSLKISNGKWNWFAKGIGGDAIEFLIQYKGMTFAESVRTLIGESCWDYPLSPNDTARNGRETPFLAKPTIFRHPFVLPAAYSNNDRVFKYLLKRGIAYSSIQKCVDSGTLYESKKYHNCVFVGMDGSFPKYAYLKGTAGKFTGEVLGSRKLYGFRMPPETPLGENRVAVFESPVDALAHHGLCAEPMANDEAIHGMDRTWDGYRLSLGGVSMDALGKLLEECPQVTSIYLCLDNDKRGHDAAIKIYEAIVGNTLQTAIQVFNMPAPIGKDYAETAEALARLRILGRTC